MTIKPITTNEIFQQVLSQSKAQGFSLVAPNSYIQEGEDIIGGITFVSAPLVWTDPKKFTARKSLQLIETLESMAYLNNARLACFPVTEDCNYHKHMKGLGYGNVGPYNLFMKVLK